MGNITSANATLMLTIAGLYNTSAQIQGFATDDAFDFPDVEIMETMLGVDGVLSAGIIPVAFDQEISLQADSASNQVFDQWYATQKAQGVPLVASGTVIVSSIGIQYTLKTGYLVRYKPAPKAAKVLQARKYLIRWQNLIASQYAGL